MRTYLVLVLFLAIAVPMAIKFGIEHSGAPTGAAAPGPCMLNNNFSSEPLLDRVLPKNLDTLNKPDAFQPALNNQHKPQMVNFEGFQEDTSNRVGQNCQFGQCLPGNQQQPNGGVE